jgi:acetyl esterase/lipase
MSGTRHLQDRIDPQLREPLRLLMDALPPGGLHAIRDLVQRRAIARAISVQDATSATVLDEVRWEDRVIAGLGGIDQLRVRVYLPRQAVVDAPAILFIHGGGMIIGDIDFDHDIAAAFCRDVGAVVVAIEYRLAPEHPHPAPSDDCYAALQWMIANVAALGADPDRYAIVGISAGGGLALSTGLRCRDEGFPLPRLILAAYPMIDDRQETPSSQEFTGIGIWDREHNAEAWRLYLGGLPPDNYSSPARTTDLTGFPPTFIDVGELDTFRDEDVAFVVRLLRAGVPAELHVYPGAFHASEYLVPSAEISSRILQARRTALARALRREPGGPGGQAAAAAIPVGNREQGD